MQTNLSGLAEALGFSRQNANRLSRLPGFPYLRKPGEQGATRWLVDVGQVRRWLEKREEMAVAEADWSLERGKTERVYRDFWSQLLRRGYRPSEISYIRDRCYGVEDLKREAKRRGIRLGE